MIHSWQFFGDIHITTSTIRHIHLLHGYRVPPIYHARREEREGKKKVGVVVSAGTAPRPRAQLASGPSGFPKRPPKSN